MKLVGKGGRAASCGVDGIALRVPCLPSAEALSDHNPSCHATPHASESGETEASVDQLKARVGLCFYCCS